MAQQRKSLLDKNYHIMKKTYIKPEFVAVRIDNKAILEGLPVGSGTDKIVEAKEYYGSLEFEEED